MAASPIDPVLENGRRDEIETEAIGVTSRGGGVECTQSLPGQHRIHDEPTSQPPNLEPPERLPPQYKIRNYYLGFFGNHIYATFKGLSCQRIGVEKTFGHIKKVSVHTVSHEVSTKGHKFHQTTSQLRSKISMNSGLAIGGSVTRKWERTVLQTEYIVVGILNRKTGIPRERVMVLLESGVVDMDPEPLFSKIRAANRKIWPLYKRLFSLKSVSGFGLYECNAELGYHNSVEIDNQTRLTLVQFYQDYQHLKQDFSGRWRHWVHKSLNNSSFDPTQGRYTLELTLRWSIFKIMVYGLTPVIASLAIGFWYMESNLAKTDDLSSRLAVIQTAWGIASYIVGAAGVTFAILAAITQIADA